MAAGGLLAVVTVGCSPPPDAPIPPHLRTSVSAARASLDREWEDRGPRTFRYLHARCREDGGLLLLFDQHGPFGSDGIAIAMSGNPAWATGAWAGGFAPINPATDPEIAGFFASSPEVACPLD